jgi:hypothetical protein
MSLAQKVQRAQGLLWKWAMALNLLLKGMLSSLFKAGFQAKSLAHFVLGDSLAGAELMLIL